MKRWVGLASIQGRWLAPLLLAVFALTAITVGFALQWRDADQRVTELETRRLLERLGVEQSRLSAQSGLANTLLVRRLVGGLGVYSGMLHAYLVDDSGLVVASLARSDIGRKLGEVLDRHPELAGLRTFDTVIQNGSSIQVVRLPHAPQLLGRAALDTGGHLFAVTDLSLPLAQRQVWLREQVAREALLLILLVGLLAVLAHLIWFRRAQRLARALASMGEGHLQVRAGLRGSDELALIGNQADRMAERLQAGQAQLRRMNELVDRSPVVVIEWRNQAGWPMSYLSRSVTQWGYQPDALMRKAVHYNDLIHPDDLDRVNAESASHYAHGPDEYRQEYRLRRADGQWAWVDDRTSLTRDEAGRVESISGVLLDITAQKEAQLAQREQAEMLRLFYELPFIGMAISSPYSTHWLQVNDRLCDILGYPREELLRLTWAEMTPSPDLEHNLALLEQMKAGRCDSYQMHKRFVRKDGSHVHTEIEVRAVRQPDGTLKHLFAMVEDVTERMRASMDLSEQKNLLVQAEAMAGLGSWSFGVESGKVWWSSQMYRNFGMEEAQGPAPDLATYLDCLHPDDRERVALFMQARHDDDAQPCHLEFRRHPRLGPERWFRGSVRRNQSEGTNAHRFSGTLLDVTPLKQAQTTLERINSELEQRVEERTAQLSAANEELEAFSYTVSHDLKAPLRGIDGYSQLLEEEYGDRFDEEGREFIGRIRRGVQQMGALISDLLAYSRMERRTMEQQQVELLPLLERVLEEHGADIRDAGTHVKLHIEPMLLRLDREGLAVVLRNLIGNAVKFSQGRTPPVVEIGARQEAGRRLLWVRDNGVGFDMKYHERIFGIFQRLQRAEDYAGTGVGLALVAKAVQRMGGRVHAESRPGEGATFFLEFPE